MLDIISNIKNELKLHTNYSIGEMDLIREKDGVWVFRTQLDKESVVIKYFEMVEDRREIYNYKMLNTLNILTMEVILYGTTFLVLEDINVSPIYRLGIEDDLLDEVVAKNLANWYFDFHEKGFLFNNINNLYSEIDYITLENLNSLMDKFHEAKDVIEFIISHYEKWESIIKSYPKTFNYNDFYWTNILVARENDKAMPYDYNYLGAGHRDNDINNVLSSLSKDAGQVFIDTYNEQYFLKYGIERSISERIVTMLCKVSSTLFTVIKACEMVELPYWAQEDMETVKSDGFYEIVREMLK